MHTLVRLGSSKDNRNYLNGVQIFDKELLTSEAGVMTKQYLQDAGTAGRYFLIWRLQISIMHTLILPIPLCHRKQPTIYNLSVPTSIEQVIDFPLELLLHIHRPCTSSKHSSHTVY